MGWRLLIAGLRLGCLTAAGLAEAAAVKIDDAGDPGALPGASRQVVRTASSELDAAIRLFIGAIRAGSGLGLTPRFRLVGGLKMLNNT